jgi:hypothetical protein
MTRSCRPSTVLSSWSATPTVAPSSPRPAAGLNTVKALVYVAAFALDKGESAATVLPADKYPGSPLTPDKLVVRKYPDSSAQGGTNAGHSRRSDIKPLTGDTSYAEMMRSRRPDSSRREWTSSFRNTLRRW